MNSYPSVDIRPAEIGELDEVLALQKKCYYSEALCYNDFSIPPLTQTLEQLCSDFENGEICLRASVDGFFVAAVRGRRQGDTGYIGKLIVDPAFQNAGIGTKLLRMIEESLGTCRRFELFTGHQSAKNLYLYRKNGYRIFREERVNASLLLLYLEKFNYPAILYR